MPYATPTSPATSPMLTTHSLGRPGHRRSYSAHQPTNTSTTVTSSPGGAFTSLRPPSRKQKFHLNPSSSSSSESEDDDGPPPPLKLRAPLSPSFGGVPFPRSSPLNSPVPNERDGGLLSPLAGLQTHITNLPGSPRTSPRSSSQNISVSTANPSYLAVPKRPQPSRTASSPILLSNGKPLKSSLKSSSSTSNIPVQHPSHPNYQPHQHRVHHHHHHQPTSHQRVRSAPSTPWAEGGAGKDDDEEAEDRSPSPSPSTAPSTPKNVHFPSLPNDLEHIRVFNKSAKPISFLRRSSDVSRGPTGVISTGDVEIGGETETETETDTSKGGYWGTGAGSKWGMSGYLKSSVGFSWGGVGSGAAGGGGQGQQGFPFPRVPSPPRIPSPPKQKEEVEEYLELDLKEGYDVSSQSTADKHVVLEKIQLERGKGEIKLLLTVLVKNIAYEKQVYFRFTMDDWATVSEVGGKYVESVTAPKGVSAVGRTLGDIISMSSSLHTRCASEPSLGASASHDSYDRFLITLSLTDYLHLNLENRVMWGVVRYTVPGKGEWWDNNGGKNYRVGWKKVVVVKPQPQPQPQPSRERKEVPAPSRAIAMSAPASTLSQPPPSISVMSTSPPASSLSSFTMPAYAPPMSMSASPPTSSFMSSYSASPPTSSFMSSYSPPKPYSPPKSYSPPDTNTTPATYSPTMTKISLPTSPPDTRQTEALSQATQNRLSKFSLRNYVAPGSVPHAAPTTKPAPAKPSISISIEGATPEKKKPEQGKGLGLHWPWHSGASTTTSSSSTSTNSTPTPKASDPSSTTEPKSQSPVVTPGGSATVEILGSGKKDYFGDVGVGSPSTKSSSTPVPVPASVSRTSSMSSTNSDGVPSLDEDGHSTGSTTSTSSSESLDSLMFGGRSSSPYQHHQQPQSYRDDEFVGFDWHGVHGLHNDEEKGNSGSETEKPLSQEQSQFEVSPSPSPIEESPVMVTPPTSNGNEGLYKAFVEKWCFAESPRGTAGGARGLEVSS